MTITLDTELTDEGIVCTHPVLGQIATIKRDYIKSEEVEDNGQSWLQQAGRWFVYPYRFAAYRRGARFDSLRAAEFYVLALAYEQAELAAWQDVGHH